MTSANNGLRPPHGQIACFGELLLRLGAPRRELLLQSPQLEVNIAGAEANVAVGLAALGHTPRMISRVADNALGAAAVGYLRRYGVDTGAVSLSPGRMGIYFLTQGAGLRGSDVIYDRQSSSFALCTARDFDWDTLLSGVDLLHMSGITPALGLESAAMAIAAAQSAERLGVTLSFDGNYRAQLWESWDSDPAAILAELIGRATILFGNHRDIALLLGRDFDGDDAARDRDAAESAFHAFPGLKLIASTSRRVEDADCHLLAARIDTPSDAFQTQAIRVSGIVDRIGAGDAFAAGVLHGVRSGFDLERTARAGHALMCLKHSLPGDASLFTSRDLDHFSDGSFDVRR